MRLLALETATVEVGAAVVVDGDVRAAVTTRPGRRHAETLHPAVESACRLAGVDLGELDAVAVDVGPGLFTGLRVGVAAAKAFAFALGVPLVAFTSLDVLHHATRSEAGAVAAVVDMRRGELAFSLRHGIPGGAGSASGPGGAGARAGTLPVELAGAETLAEAVVAAGEAVLAVGDGARRYGDALVELVAKAGGPPVRIAGAELGAPPVASLAVLAAERLAADPAGAVDPVTLEPVYLRPVDARINWTTRDAPAGAAAGAGGG